MWHLKNKRNDMVRESIPRREALKMQRGNHLAHAKLATATRRDAPKTANTCHSSCKPWTNQLIVSPNVIQLLIQEQVWEHAFAHNETTYASPACAPCTATTSHIGSIHTPASCETVNPQKTPSTSLHASQKDLSVRERTTDVAMEDI